MGIDSISRILATEALSTANSLSGDIDNLKRIQETVFEPSGFSLPQDFTHNTTIYINLSFNDGTRTFSISPVGESYDIVSNGTFFTKTTTEIVQINNTDGLHFIYFDNDGTLKTSESVEFFNDGHVAIAYVYWNVAEQKSVVFGLESHGAVMDWGTHLYAHESNGSKYINGLLAGNYTLVGDGSSNADAQLSISNGQIDDEDLRYFITHSATPSNFGEQKLSTIAEIPVMYRSGVGGIWNIDSVTQFPVKQGTARIKYNLNTAGTWSTPDVDADDKYMAMWIFATNNKTPILAVLGQRVDVSLEDAKTNNTYSSLDFGNIPFVEFKSLWRLIFKTNSTYANTPKAILQDVESLLNINAIQISSISTTDHNTLTNRSATGSHPSSSISFNNITSGYTATQTQDAIDEVITKTANKVSGATNGNFAGLNASGELTDSGKKDADYVHSTGDETITGTKTFSTTPIIPVTAPTLDTQATNKKYVDDGLLLQEKLTNKATVLTTSNDILYPTVKAVNTALALKEPTVTKGNLTAGSTKITIGGTGTGSVIGAGVSVDVNEANLTLNNIGGTLSIAKGGTNSTTALNNNRLMVSSGDKIVEATAITASKALASDVNGIPVATNVTTTELGYVSGVTSAIQTQINGKQASLGFTAENVANKDTDGTLASNSDTKYPSQKAVKTYADTKEPLVTKGNISTTTTGLSIGGSATNSVIGSGVTINIQNANTSQNGLLTSTDWNTFNGKQSALGFTPEDSANKSTSTSLGTSNTLYPTQGAVKSYVDTGLGTKEPTLTKGNLTGTNVSVTGGTGAVIGSGVAVSIPQSVATTATPTFASVTTTAHFNVSIGTTTITNGTLNDVVIPDTDVVFITASTGNATITGIAGGYSGRLLRIVYTGGNNITFSNQNSGSIATNRFNTLGSNFVTNGAGSVSFVHDGTGWFLLGGVT